MKIKDASLTNILTIEIVAAILVAAVLVLVGSSTLRPAKTYSTFSAAQPLVVARSITKPAAKVAQPAKSLALPVQPAAPLVKPLPIVPPQLVNQVIPVYPEQAVRDEVEGTVLLNLKIGTDGKVVKTQIKHSSGAEILDAAAIKAAADWLFVPAKRGAESISAIFEVPVSFVLSD